MSTQNSSLSADGTGRREESQPRRALEPRYLGPYGIRSQAHWRGLWLALLLFAVAAGCAPEGARCAKCGMRVDDHPRWVAGAVTAGEGEERFCCPRCLFAWRGSPRGAGSHDAWVTEYYSQKRTPVADVLFVMGTDVVGPMGKSLVPVSGREAAERFRQDHAGSRLLRAEEVTPELLRELAGKPAEPAKP
jgi:copper chaperone NosL